MVRKNIILQAATRVYLGIVLFFFLMKLLHLEQIFELRLLNFLIVFWGVNWALKKNILENRNTSFLENFSLALSVSVLAIVSITISAVIYLYQIDPSFIGVLESYNIWGNKLNPQIIGFALLIEGMGSSMVCSFVLMQYWKSYKIPTLAN